jgi:hypothetical protein
MLQSEGHDVRTVAERRGARTPDLMACGASVEVKSFQTLAERQGRPPSAEKVANKLLDARGQGAIAIVSAGGSGLGAAAARAGYGLFCDQAASAGLGKVRAVRILGDGFDMSFKAVHDVRLARQALKSTARPAADPVRAARPAGAVVTAPSRPRPGLQPAL